MSRKTSSSIVLMSVAMLGALSLTGCGQARSAREIMGLESRAPDAFSVSPHAALEVPSDLTTLPKPQLGAPRPQETTAQQQAKEALLSDGRVAQSSETMSAAEQALLMQAGAPEADTADIRNDVEKEAAEDAQSHKHPLSWLAFWRKDQGPGVVVDAQAEAERLAKARAAGESPVATATPVISTSGQMNAPKEIK